LVGFSQRTAIVFKEWVLAKVGNNVYREERGSVEMKESGLLGGALFGRAQVG
jgi:hypothetical protein